MYCNEKSWIRIEYVPVRLWYLSLMLMRDYGEHCVCCVVIPVWCAEEWYGTIVACVRPPATFGRGTCVNTACIVQCSSRAGVTGRPKGRRMWGNVWFHLVTLPRIMVNHIWNISGVGVRDLSIHYYVTVSYY